MIYIMVYCIFSRGVFESFLWIKAFVTLLMVWCACLSIWRIYSTAVKPLFHPSSGFRAPDRNNSPSGKNCFISALLCPSWKMKNALLMYGMKTKGTWLKDLEETDVSAILVVWMVLFFFFLSLIFLWGTFKDACCPAALRSGPLTLDKMDPLYQSPAQPRRGESATNNIITAIVHISLIWQQPSLTNIPLTRSHTPLLGFIIIIM